MDKYMTEPTAAAAAMGVKALGWAWFAGIAAGAVAMALTPPKTKKEFASRIIATVITSIMVGPLTVDVVKNVAAHFGFVVELSQRSEVAIWFLTGVPAWLIWSWVIHRLEDAQDKSVAEVAEAVRKLRGE